MPGDEGRGESEGYGEGKGVWRSRNEGGGGGETHLDGVLELLVLPLQLLGLLQGAGSDEPRVQHRLAVPDPAQDLNTARQGVRELLHTHVLKHTRKHKHSTVG